MYLGYMGEEVIAIDLKVKKDFFPLKAVSENVKSFIVFLNHVLKVEDPRFTWYIYVMTKAIPAGEITFEKYPVQAFTYEQMQQQKSEFEQKTDKTFVALNPFLLKAEIRFEQAGKSQQLYPMIYGAINPEAVVKE
jgi:hypothetical protein